MYRSAPRSPRPTGLNHPDLRRRDVLRLLGLSGAAVAGGGMLSACGTEGTADNAAQQVEDLSTEEQVVNFSNWPLYIDQRKGSNPTLDRFRKRSGLEVNYSEEINDNASYFAKIRPQLSSGQATGSDIIVLTNDWAGHMIELGWVQELDLGNIPNSENLIETLANATFDPERKYSLPWQSGLTGIGTNLAAAGREVTSMEDLLTSEDLRGRVTVLSEFTDTMGLLMSDLGIDPEDFSQSEFDDALSKLRTAMDVGQIRQVTGNEYAPRLAKGDVAAAVAWSGDVIQLQFEGSDVSFALPEKGGQLWSDNMQVPALATHKANAEQLMNYYYEPKVAAEVAAWVNYICPVEGAQEAMRDVDASLADNELIFPSESTLSKAFGFKSLEWDQREQLVEQFTQTVGL